MCTEIKTDRLILRPFEKSDEDAVVDILNDFSVSKWLAKIAHPFTHTDLKLTTLDGKSRWPDLMAVICDGHLIGAVSGSAHLGYYLAPVAWGQGFATEAARAAVKFRFASTSDDAIQSGYFCGNETSGNVLRKLGFVETGRSYQSCRARDCEVAGIDMKLTRNAWEARI